MANTRRLAATRFPLKTLNSESNAAARITLTIQREPTRVLEGNRRHELLAGKFPPRSHVTDGRNHDGVEENAHQDRHPDGLEKSPSAEFRAGLLRPLDHRLKASHVIRHDLNDQQYGNESAVGEQGRKILR